ncbi:hypothetical protein O9992_21510 [Vibrio lentus]|nr:hypothetical protein [Vibrio lentus]
MTPNGVVFKSGMVAAIAIFGTLDVGYLLPIRTPQFKSGIVEMVN